MKEPLARLAGLYGVEPGYVSEAGHWTEISDAAKRGVLAAMGVDAVDDEAVARALAIAPPPVVEAPVGARCFVPEWLPRERAWGISCQLYGLRSSRNLGIGDFEDLARLGEVAGGAGADFIGVNPLHALFFSDPSRVSPYSPSDRRFLNPLYIAIDRLGGGPAAFDEATAFRASDFVDYVGVAGLKRQALREAYAALHRRDADALSRYREERGESLDDFALFESLSEHFAETGAGWMSWPSDCRGRDSDAVRRFADEHTDAVAFHAWLQWVAERQLAEAQARARAAGMRIGLFLDLAVGVAPDGAATWADPGLVTSMARIGAPPDLFNAHGQDWGLSPVSPARLGVTARPFAEMLGDIMRSAGAVRIDHAMGLKRQWWIPSGHPAADGAYVRYPSGALVAALAEQSHERRAIVVGEDLGTVPFGFREEMAGANILSCRVLYFERSADGRFIPPERYPPCAMACLSTHDLPTLRGWWDGADLDLRTKLGLLPLDSAEQRRAERQNDRRALIEAVAGDEPCDPAGPANQAPVLAAHRFLARTPSWLCAAQLEDVLGMREQHNLPGTIDSHPNWRRKLPVALEALEAHPMFQEIAAVMRAQRPRTATLPAHPERMGWR